jgi:hypothetical protein
MYSCMKIGKMRPVETILRRGIVPKNDGRGEFN